VIGVLNDGLVRAVSRVGTQLFSRRAHRARRGYPPKRCVECKRAIVSGDLTWGEVTSCAINRVDRVCDHCMANAIDAHIEQRMSETTKGGKRA
jgi:hypothetical protein